MQALPSYPWPHRSTNCVAYLPCMQIDPEADAMLEKLLNALPDSVLFTVAVHDTSESGSSSVQVRRLHGSPLVLKQVLTDLRRKLALEVQQRKRTRLWGPELRHA